ncbi:MAG: hypothetical protein JXP72_00305 [Coriobacteriia bacterium]|nr:hypothetical protein [Coriobacteriia bacterium]
MGIGGAEWLIIGGMLLVLLFVPGAAVFALGYVLGKKSGETGAAAPGPVAPPAKPPAPPKPPVLLASGEPDAGEPVVPPAPTVAPGVPADPPAEVSTDE